jgi:hypothetical protein
MQIIIHVIPKGTKNGNSILEDNLTSYQLQINFEWID